MADRAIYTNPLGFVGSGLARTAKFVGGSFSLLTTDLALNRTTGLFIVPKGFVVGGHFGNITDVDTNGSPAFVFTIGDSGDTDRLMTISTKGQAGALITDVDMAVTGIGYEFTADTEIFMTATTAAATAAAGTLNYFLRGYMKF